MGKSLTLSAGQSGSEASGSGPEHFTPPGGATGAGCPQERSDPAGLACLIELLVTSAVRPAEVGRDRHRRNREALIEVGPAPPCQRLRARVGQVVDVEARPVQTQLAAEPEEAEH